MKIKLTLPFETLRRFGVPDALVDLAAQVTETVSMGMIQATEDADAPWEAPVAPPPPRREAAPTSAQAAAYTSGADAEPAPKKAAPKKAAPKASAKKAAPKKAAPKKAAPKKAAPKKAAAEASAPEKAAPKKAAPTKAAAKKAGPKKSATKKSATKKGKGSGTAPGKKTAAIAASDNPWLNYYNSLPERSQSFLDLLEKRGTMTIDEAVEIMGLPSTRSLGGVTGALSRWAPKAGVELPYETGMNDNDRRYWTWTRK